MLWYVMIGEGGKLYNRKQKCVSMIMTVMNTYKDNVGEQS
jgi:hypothetical protein